MEEQATNPVVKPPTESKGILRWLKENLFNTWYNALFTLFAIAFLSVIFKEVLTWAFVDANWGVIPANLQIFLVGAYPREEIWRVWIVIYTLGLLLGLSAGIWGGLALRLALVIGGIGGGFGIILAFFPATFSNKFGLLGGVVLLAAALFLGRGRKGLRPWVLGGWLLSFPWTMIWLHGFAGLPTVFTSNWGGLLLTLISRGCWHRCLVFH